MDLLRRHKQTQRRKKFLAQGIFFALVLLLIAGATYLGIYGYRAYTAARSLQNSIERIETAAETLDFTVISTELTQARAHTVELEDNLARLKVLSYVPYVGAQYKASAELASIGHAVLDDAARGIAIFERLYKAITGGKSIESFGDITEVQKGFALAIIQEEGATLKTLQADLATQTRRLDAIPTSDLHPILTNTIAEIQGPLSMISSLFSTAAPLLDGGPAMVGYPTQKTYLFLMQNNTEVRATGGFIGNYGILKLRNGEIKDFFTDNIYNIDDKALPYLQVPPPAPFGKYFRTNRWFLRDSNWYPDFSESAKKAIWFYHQEGGTEKIDGVISITQDFITPLLRFTGPIEVEGIVFTADNFEQELQYQVEKGYDIQGIPERQRKEIIGVLSDKILDRLFSLPPERFPDLLATVQRLIQEKQLLVYFEDPVLQGYARSQNWTGEFAKTDNDFVMVVDSNMGAMKTDLVMDKYIDYSIRESIDGKVYAKVDLYYTNNGTFTWFTTRYRDWVRIYVPQGSTFVRAEGAMEKELSDQVGKVEIGNELDKTFFGAYIVVEPKATKHYSVEYILPPRIAEQIRNGTYHLTVQKQAGTSGQRFKADLSFLRAIKAYEPTGFFNTKTDRNSVQFQSDLRVDQMFSVTF